MCLKYCCMYGKQCRPWSDAAFCSIWSGSTLFAKACLSQYLLWYIFFQRKKIWQFMWIICLADNSRDMWKHYFLWKKKKKYFQILSAAIVIGMLRINPYSANHNNCRLPYHLLVILSHFCKQCGPRSDCSFRSSLIWVHTVCLYAKIGLKSLQEYSADDINRRHFQIQVFLAL